MKFAIVVSEFNEMITDKLLEECLRGFKEQDIEPIVLKVPGAVEIPYAIQKLSQRHELAAAVALGCVVKGETEHYDMVNEMCAQGIMQVMLKHNIPVVFEVLMVDSYQKAEARIDKGYHAAFVATKMAKLV